MLEIGNAAGEAGTASTVNSNGFSGTLIFYISVPAGGVTFAGITLNPGLGLFGDPDPDTIKLIGGNGENSATEEHHGVSTENWNDYAGITSSLQISTSTFFGAAIPLMPEEPDDSSSTTYIYAPRYIFQNDSVPCFIAGTIVETDQGLIPIENVTTSNTIRKLPIFRVSKCIHENNLVLIKKDAFGKDRPNKDTIATDWHGVYLNKNDEDFVRLKDLINNDTIIKKDMEKTYVYNIGMKNIHTYMLVNNLEVETMNPSHRGW